MVAEAAELTSYVDRRLARLGLTTRGVAFEPPASAMRQDLLERLPSRPRRKLRTSPADVIRAERDAK
jgi:hypothetical protein